MTRKKLKIPGIFCEVTAKTVTTTTMTAVTNNHFFLLVGDFFVCLNSNQNILYFQTKKKRGFFQIENERYLTNFNKSVRVLSFQKSKGVEEWERRFFCLCSLRLFFFFWKPAFSVQFLVFFFSKKMTSKFLKIAVSCNFFYLI